MSTSSSLSRWRTFADADTAPELPLHDMSEAAVQLTPTTGPRAIEDESFPFETLSKIAEKESWRKEINRPTTHIHKWWAQRLGTVFRAMVIGAFAPSGIDQLELFHKPVRVRDRIVFDPFMGSGTTLLETVKLGARGIGRDINSVAHFLVKCALSAHDRRAILSTFRAIEVDVAETIRNYYRTQLPDGRVAEVLYYFWVKVAKCPSCTESVDLFSSMIFARHAYPKKFPRAQAVCPSCDAINEVHIRDTEKCCCSCGNSFDPNRGPANGQIATCPNCNDSFRIVKTVRAEENPPDHRLYAKLVLMPDGKKAYLPVSGRDRELYVEAKRALAAKRDPFPIVKIFPGYNTNQVLGYNYRYWHEMFNARQLLCLSILADRIRVIGDPILRELFTCLFSGVLEFNNMFASYKGEGTGAVRHMFAHHILKPERTPLEANLWGTAKSSGSFSTMFEGRIRRALDYADNPFELQLFTKAKRHTTKKVFGLSEKIGFDIAASYTEFCKGRRVYLSCGDSSATDLPDSSVDAVLTDPPFFDNVHYSQLADFFHVWQRHILDPDGARLKDTTRSEREVQTADADDFSDRLCSVLQEACRVLKDDGVLAFTYHHSRPEGWRCVLNALMDAGFGVTATHPIKAEMSVAMPKHQAKEPIDLDIIVVCRKRSQLRPVSGNDDLWYSIAPRVTEQVLRLIDAGRSLSRNDVRIIVMAQLLRELSHFPSAEQALRLLDKAMPKANMMIDRAHSLQQDPRTCTGANQCRTPRLNSGPVSRR